MDLTKYQVFLKTVECGSFTAAAQQLSFTQSGVSHAISGLEEELGVTLLSRSRGGVTLTADGWAECTDVPGYAYKQTAELRAAREANVPSAVPTPETFTVAVAAGLAGVCETGGGTITFWAEKVPEGGIQMQVELLGPSASTADTGEDTLGDTVLEDTTL